MHYIAEIASISVPMPTGARVFVLIAADNDHKAIETVNALGIIRHDKRVQIDVFMRDGSTIGRKIWSGLSKPQRLHPRLSVVA